MAEMTFRRVVVDGIDNPLGKLVIKELLDRDISVTALVYNTIKSEHRTYFSGYCPYLVRKVYSGDTSGMVSVLNGHDAVISTASGFRTLPQRTLIDAAKLANIKCYIPSNFGPDIDHPETRTHQPLWPARQVQKALDQSGLDHITIACGYVAEDYLDPGHVWNQEDNLITIHGDGTARNSFTPLADVAKYIVAVFQRFEEFKNTTVRLASYTMSELDWVAAIERTIGKRVAIEYEDDLPLSTESEGGTPKLCPTCEETNAYMLANGGALIDWGTHTLDNHKFSEIVPTPIEEIINKAASHMNV